MATPLQFAHNRLQLCIFVALLAPFLRGISSQNDDNRRQLWALVDKQSPHLLSPHLDFPDPCRCFQKAEKELSVLRPSLKCVTNSGRLVAISR